MEVLNRSQPRQRPPPPGNQPDFLYSNSNSNSSLSLTFRLLVGLVHLQFGEQTHKPLEGLLVSVDPDEVNLQGEEHPGVHVCFIAVQWAVVGMHFSYFAQLHLAVFDVLAPRVFTAGTVLLPHAVPEPQKHLESVLYSWFYSLQKQTVERMTEHERLNYNSSKSPKSKKNEQLNKMKLKYLLLFYLLLKMIQYHMSLIFWQSWTSVEPQLILIDPE